MTKKFEKSKICRQLKQIIDLKSEYFNNFSGNINFCNDPYYIIIKLKYQNLINIITKIEEYKEVLFRTLFKKEVDNHGQKVLTTFHNFGKYLSENKISLININIRGLHTHLGKLDGVLDTLFVNLSMKDEVNLNSYPYSYLRKFTFKENFHKLIYLKDDLIYNINIFSKNKIFTINTSNLTKYENIYIGYLKYYIRNIYPFDILNFKNYTSIFDDTFKDFYNTFDKKFLSVYNTDIEKKFNQGFLDLNPDIYSHENIVKLILEEKKNFSYGFHKKIELYARDFENNVYYKKIRKDYNKLIEKPITFKKRLNLITTNNPEFKDLRLNILKKNGSRFNLTLSRYGTDYITINDVLENKCHKNKHKKYGAGLMYSVPYFEDYEANRMESKCLYTTNMIVVNYNELPNHIFWKCKRINPLFNPYIKTLIMSIKNFCKKFNIKCLPKEMIFLILENVKIKDMLEGQSEKIFSNKIKF